MLTLMFQVLEIVLSRLPYRAISWVRQAGVKRALNKFLFSPRHSSLPRHIILTLVLVSFSLGVGLTTDDLSIVPGIQCEPILAGGRGGWSGGLKLFDEGFKD